MVSQNTLLRVLAIGAFVISASIAVTVVLFWYPTTPHVTQIEHPVTKQPIPLKVAKRDVALDRWFTQISGNLPTLTRSAAEHLTLYSVVIDVGANVGAFSKAMLDSCPTCSVIAFEAVPRYAQYIRDRLGTDRQYKDRITVAQHGLSNTSDPIDIVIDDQNLGWNTIYTEKNNGKILTVPMDTGDHYFQQHATKNIALIKIDTEGAEHRVLQGLRKTLASTNPKPWILVELGWGSQHPEAQAVQRELLYLESIGYVIQAHWRNLRPETHDLLLKPKQ